MERHAGAGRTGFSLVEVSMVLAIAAIVIASVMAYYGNANQNARSKEAVSELGLVIVIAHDLFKGFPDYTGISSGVIAGSGQLPAGWGGGTASMTSPWRLPAQVAPSGPGAAFSVKFTQVPFVPCVKLSMVDFGTEAYGFSVNSTSFYGPPPATTLAIATCGSSNAMTWFFY